MVRVEMPALKIYFSMFVFYYLYSSNILYKQSRITHNFFLSTIRRLFINGTHLGIVNFPRDLIQAFVLSEWRGARQSSFLSVDHVT